MLFRFCINVWFKKVHNILPNKYISKIIFCKKQIKGSEVLTQSSSKWTWHMSYNVIYFTSETKFCNEFWRTRITSHVIVEIFDEIGVEIDAKWKPIPFQTITLLKKHFIHTYCIDIGLRGWHLDYWILLCEIPPAKFHRLSVV